MGGAAGRRRFAEPKFAYIRLNMPAPCPPRSVFPVHRLRVPLARVLEGLSATTSVGMRLSERCAPSEARPRNGSHQRFVTFPSLGGTTKLQWASRQERGLEEQDDFGDHSFL